MKVRMTEHRDNPWYEDGQWRSYPPVGEVLETNSTHAADLCAQGYAKPVADRDADVETRDAPAQNEPKAVWVAHAVSQGAKPGDAEAMTKQQLIDAHGS